ncbi:MAG TPA: hypothetical protein PLQ93_08760 [Bacteroidia bacterium]|nr:hypothetical protein [Bacteroidia bacterium]
MKYKIKWIALLLAVELMQFSACKKAPGEGGKASIHGKIWVEDWNAAFTIKNGEYAGYDRDVYIVYGDVSGYSDRIKADYKGEFEFRYLRKGNYTVYVYSKDSSLNSKSGDTAFVQKLEISSKKQNLTLNTFTVFE